MGTIEVEWAYVAAIDPDKTLEIELEPAGDGSAVAVSLLLKIVAYLDYYTYSDYQYTYSRMKAKLTITVDEDLIPEAKRHARSRGQSLSQLVEDGLRRAIAERDTGFAQRWRGRFRAARGEDARFAHLAKKYLDP